MLIKNIVGFDWDSGNKDKNEAKHGVTGLECEEVFFNKPLVIARVPYPVKGEKRFAALGKTHGKRFLFLIFTIRRRKIRVISARPMSRKERLLYEKEAQA